MTRTLSRIIFWVVASSFASVAAASPPAPPAVSPKRNSSPIRPFLEAHCFDCHGDTDQKGGLRLDTLAVDFTNPATQRTWVEVYDKISTGQMPPKKKARPPVTQTQQVLTYLKNGISAVELAERAADGRVMLRRLNRNEYENTVRDLLGIDAELKDLLPEDTSSMGFDNIAEALNVSSVLMERYLEAADVALDAAITTGPQPAVKHFDVAYGFDSKNPKDYRLNSGVTVLEDGTFVLFNSSDYAPVVCDRIRVPVAGRYKIKMHAYAYRSQTPLTMSVLAGSFQANTSQRHVVGYFDVPVDAKKPKVIEWTDHLPRNGTVKVLTYHLGTHSLDTPEKVKEYTGPGVALGHVEMDGPLYESWPPPSYARLFGNLDVSNATAADVPKVLGPFAARAFRRPVDAGHLAPFVDQVKLRIDAGEPFLDAIRVGLKSILCSPDFLFLKERPGKLDDFAVASRLSYFLWSSMPDDELTRVAANHTLTQPAVLRQQTERLLKDSRESHFTVDFTGQWLNLRQIDATTPEKRFYRRFDQHLQWSMVQEAQLFFDELVKNDLSIANVIDSDFAIINGPLAELYSIPGVDGTELRKVKLPPESHRGGVLAQAAVLKVTANGSTTSPVIRGSWVMRNILGRPPKPPPPNVPAIEPDIRGATSIRDLLDKHRTQAVCASCHATIDPPGFALESFDVIGGWRDNYHTYGGGLATGKDSYLNGKNKFGNKPFPNLDASGTMPDGRRFANFDQFKKLLLEDKDQIARCLAEKLLVYSTGAALDFVDRPAVDTIVQHVRDHGYGLRTMIHEVVESPVFLNK